MSTGQSYEVLEVLGSGGFGTVYRAKFLGEGGFAKEVALKVLNPDVEGIGEVASRLRDEARILGLLRHRAIVNVDRLTMLEGRWTVVMEYVEGWDLSELLKEGPAPPVAALEIVAEVAGALHAAYTRPGPNGKPLQLLHRDLKPSNIRLTPFGEVKVLDFGIARAEFESREAKTQSLSFGTPAYMSPERLDAQPDGPEGDVYALGVIVYELLTAQRLGKTSANPASHAKKFQEARETMERMRLPAALVDFVLGALAYDYAERPTAETLEAEALDLARRLEGPGLRRWVSARRGTPARREETPSLSLNLTSTILREGGSASTIWERTPGHVAERSAPGALVPGATTGTPTPRPAPVEPGRGPQRIAVAVGLLLSVGIGGWWLSQKDPPQAEAEPETKTVETPTPIEVAVVEPAMKEPEPAAKPEAPPPTGPGPATRPKAEPKPETPPPPVVKAEPKATVQLTGDLSRATLKGIRNGVSCALPCSVPAGEYRVWADFGAGSESAAGPSFTLTAPSTTVVQCDSSFLQCSPRR